MSRFTGLSTLRAAEKAKEPAPQNKALQDYLKRQYGDGGASEEQKPRKKKRKVKGGGAAAGAGGGAVAILDQDISGLEAPPEATGKPLKRPEDALGYDDDDAADDEDEPVIANQDEAEALQLQVEKSKNFYAKNTDGSGWETADGGAGGSSILRQQRQRHDSPDAADMSPPRRQQQQRHDSPGLSPPRRQQQQQRHDSPGLSPPRRGRQQEQSQEMSPPRRGRQRHDSPGDVSPPWRGRHDSPGDASPPRRGRHDSPGDVSPPRRGRHDSPGDVSPPRRGQPAGSPPAAAVAAANGRARMGDGTAAGLVSSKELAEEAARMRAQAEERKRRAGGKGEATVYRDRKTGAIISAEEYAEQTAKARQKKAPPEEIHVAWKGGLAQQRAAQEAAQRAAAEATKAFGSTRGFDDDADTHLRGRDRWGDPMAGKLKKRGGAGGDGFDLPPPVITEANRAMMEASGFSIPQEVPPHSWLRRGVPPPVNRYNLRPGRHWDGVDRSTGFEKEMFKTLNQRNAQELQARMWAQEDM